ncbi:DUF742 domain-containing protein [Amycolatopsis sp. NPDC051061]|uniref:DUF742 domain-containing protein n=1 Tax=Amycolatopsis sp. NPDC051061 TaxID=3155042 RepID=UPI003435AB4C
MSHSDDEYWPGPVPAYVLTGGRTHPKARLRPETLLSALLHRPVPDRTNPQKRDLLGLCRGQLSLVETATHLGLPVSVVRVLASDLIDEGLLSIRDAGPKRELMEMVLAGLRKL